MAPFSRSRFHEVPVPALVSDLLARELQDHLGRADMHLLVLPSLQDVVALKDAPAPVLLDLESEAFRRAAPP